MKKLFTLIFIFITTVSAWAQCSISSAPTNNCASYGDRIDAFTLNSIASTGSSGCSTNGYGLFSSPVWNLQTGGIYSFSSLVGSGTESQGFAIWIDLNNDATYAATEMVWTSSNPSTSHSGTFQIPYGTAANNNVAMRIRCAYNYAIQGSDVCTNGLGTWGETEDYKVNITCPSGAPSVSVAATSTHICVGQSVTLTATGANNLAWSGGITNGVGFSPSSTTNYTVTGSISGCTGTTSVVKTVSVSTQPIAVAAVSSTNTVCAGSSVTLTAGGASSYTWVAMNQNTSTIVVGPTSNTTYSVIGYNGQGCPGSATVAINVNPVPTVVAVATPSNLCSGYISTLTVSGALNYSWQSPLNSTATSVTVSPGSSTSFGVVGYNSFGCSSIANAVVVTQASPPTTASASKTLICVGSSANLTASGANTYAWVNGPATAVYQVSPTANTIYTVTGTASNGCTKDATVAVEVFQATISVSSNTSVCIGGATQISAGAATSWSWNTTPGNTQQVFVTPTVTTIYLLDATVNVNSTLCKASNSVQVTVNPLPVVTASLSRPSMCKGETNTVTAGGASTYLWNTNAATPSFTVKGNIAPQTINYTVTGTDVNTCKGTASVSLKVDVCQSLNEQTAGMLFTTYPNPNNGSFNIVAEKEMTLVVTNELGQVIRTVLVNNENLYTARISDLSTGVYFVGELGGNSNVRSKVIVMK